MIYLSFRRRVVITKQEWLAGAERCEREALTQTEEIARTLRRCGAHYRRQAEVAGA